MKNIPCDILMAVFWDGNISGKFLIKFENSVKSKYNLETNFRENPLFLR